MEQSQHDTNILDIMQNLRSHVQEHVRIRRDTVTQTVQQHPTAWQSVSIHAEAGTPMGTDEATEEGRGTEAGMGWLAALDLDRLRPARMSQRPTSFSRVIMSRSLCSPKGSRFSLILPCKQPTSQQAVFPHLALYICLSIHLSVYLLVLCSPIRSSIFPRQCIYGIRPVGAHP